MPRTYPLWDRPGQRATASQVTPQFPGRESDLLALANAMVDGYTAHPAEFPNSDVATLETVRHTYKEARPRTFWRKGRRSTRLRICPSGRPTGEQAYAPSANGA